MSSEPLTTAPGNVSKSIPTFHFRLQTFTPTARRPHGAAGLLPLGSAPAVRHITRLVTIVVHPQSEAGRTPAMQAKGIDTGAVRNQLRLRKRPQSATISDGAGAGRPGLQF